MTALRSANLALRFFLELAMLAALAYWGFRAHDAVFEKVLFGLGAPLIAAAVWGLFVAPKARWPVPLPWRLLVEALVFGAAAVALLAAGQRTLALIFVAVVALNEILLLAWRE